LLLLLCAQLGSDGAPLLGFGSLLGLVSTFLFFDGSLLSPDAENKPPRAAKTVMTVAAIVPSRAMSITGEAEADSASPSP
jgi:hypothetical protein